MLNTEFFKKKLDAIIQSMLYDEKSKRFIPKRDYKYLYNLRKYFIIKNTD